MKNLTPFEFFDSELQENSNMMQECYAMSEGAKSVMKQICEDVLCKEAEDYHNDADESHTYEGYVNECMGYLKEMLGQPGYSSLAKHHAE
jgi:hypothetical protein